MSSVIEAPDLDRLSFDNSFTRALPADPETGNQRRQVRGACFSRITPRQALEPRLLAAAREVAALLDIPEEECLTKEFAHTFVGNRLSPGMDPYAARYGGHQFGNWAGQLGDGRAINLGEVVNGRGERWTMQLKGAGLTPYSRTADGLAVLRSSLREFLCSEAMHHLGVPTTRALSLVTTGEPVVRDMFYDGHPKAEPGAVVCRVAPSFTRFGNFEILAACGEIDVLEQLADYTIRTDFPHLDGPVPEIYRAWFEEVCTRTAEMIAHWMRVGFVHGVMNTDNMSILGLTIDYGPYGWLEDYDPDWTPNTTDAGGRRYRFGNQPQIALWNLVQLANALYPLLGETKPFEEALQAYADRYTGQQQAMMARKLGFAAFDPKCDKEIEAGLYKVLRLTETDMTIFFRNLALIDADAALTEGCRFEEVASPLAEAYYAPDDVSESTKADTLAWLQRYARRVQADSLDEEARRARMNAANPKYVLRNYIAQLAIDEAEKGDASRVEETLDVLRRPYEEQEGKEEFAEKRPEWARHRPGCSMLSCSS